MAGMMRRNPEVTTRVKADAPTGTALAIIDNNLSYPTPCKNRQKSGWGGARNFKHRQSDELSLYASQTILGAWQFSRHIGLGLNRSITIHFGRLGVGDSDSGRCVAAYLKILNDRLAKMGGQFAAVWVRENGEGKGSHVHIFAHIPAHCWPTIRNRQAVWLRKATGKQMKAGALRSRKIRGQSDQWPSNALYLANGDNVVRYLVKGVSNDVAAFLGLSRAQYGGVIIGKRSGTTQNIGRSAWAKAGWLPNVER